MENRNEFLEMDGLFWESETHEWFHDKTLLTEEISEEFENHTREELIQEILRLRKIVDRFC
jgi:hypothetical protein